MVTRGEGQGEGTDWEFGTDMYTLLYCQQFHSWAYTWKRQKLIQKDKCNHVFTAALFVIAGTWKQPKCPSTDEWIKRYIHNRILLKKIE